MSTQNSFQITPATIPVFLGEIEDTCRMKEAVIESYLKNAMARALTPKPVQCGFMQIQSLSRLNLQTTNANRDENEYAFEVRVENEPGLRIRTQSIRQLELTGSMRFLFRREKSGWSGLYYMVSQEDFEEQWGGEKHPGALIQQESAGFFSLTVSGSEIYLEDTENAAFEFYNAFLKGDRQCCERITRRMPGLISVLDRMGEEKINTPEACLDLFYDYLEGAAFDLFVSLLLKDHFLEPFMEISRSLERIDHPEPISDPLGSV